MKVALIWNFGKAKDIFDNWRDGHRAAFEEIEKHHDFDWYVGEECNDVPDKYDVLLFWTDAGDPIIEPFLEYKGKKNIIITSDNGLPGNILAYDVIYCESKPVYDKVRMFGKYAIIGMGTDTDFFRPNPKVQKDIEYFYPATFSQWKCQDKLVHLGDKLLCVGTVQPDGVEILQKCEEAGVKCEVGYIPAEKIREYYWRTNNITIPAIHGSERTVLEAMSTNILPEVTNPHNVRTRSYLEEYKNSGCKTPREFIVKNYSHKIYAEKIMKGFK